MRSTRLALLAPAMVAMLVMSGCNDGKSPEASGAAPSTAVATPSAAPTATETAAPAMDAATRSACASLNKDVESTLKEVADAEKIGPPAGHSAVSAQYSAGAAALYLHALEANEAVSAAVEQVATAMSDLADTWAKAPKKKPSREPLTAAVKHLDAACSAT
ncbi:hypothetical protein [Micromonospora sp. NPDC093277]|uniref:hypothetical protein n=1 Tax=Micromonospora sp. NPDC093277 TaxID=3364291 RepID=UPI00380BE9DC